MNRRLMAVGILFAAMGLVLIGCGSDSTPTPTPTAQATPTEPTSLSPLEELVQAAQEEGELTVLVQSGIAFPELWEAWERDINEKYNINIRLNTSPGPSFGDMTARVTQEHQAGRQASTDLLLGSPSTNGDRRANGIMENVDWRALDPSIPEEAISSDGCCVDYAHRIQTVLYHNTDIVPAAEMPMNTDDLMDPKWEGMFGSDAGASSFSRWAMLVGEERTDQLIEALFDTGNIAGYMRQEAIDRIGSGEFPIYFWGAHWAALEGKARGLPVDFHTLEEGVVLTSHTLAVPINAPHPNLAKLVLMHATSTVQGQAPVQENVHYGSIHVSGSTMADKVEEIRAAGGQVIIETPELVEENSHLYIDASQRWEEYFQAQG